VTRCTMRTAATGAPMRATTLGAIAACRHADVPCAAVHRHGDDLAAEYRGSARRRRMCHGHTSGQGQRQPRDSDEPQHDAAHAPGLPTLPGGLALCAEQSLGCRTRRVRDDHRRRSRRCERSCGRRRKLAPLMTRRDIAQFGGASTSDLAGSGLARHGLALRFVPRCLTRHGTWEFDAPTKDDCSFSRPWVSVSCHTIGMSGEENLPPI
jgi:hypothetical protein